MKLDLMGILSRLDRNDLRIYDDFRTDSTAKAELDKNASWFIPQWLTGAYDEQQQRRAILMFDEACNPGWSALYKHPELQMKLLTIVGDRGGKHRFYRPKGKNAAPVDKLMPLFLDVYEDIREVDVALWCRDSTEDDFIDLLDQCGIEQKQRGDLCKTYESVKQTWLN